MSRTTEQNGALVWSQRVLTFEDLRSRLSGVQELVLGPDVLVSPLVLDELRDRKIVLRRDGPKSGETSIRRGLGVAVKTPDGAVSGAIDALKREGFTFARWQPRGADLAAWAWSLAHLVKEQGAGVAFVSDAPLVACLAGKVNGVRASAVLTTMHATRALKGFAANLLAVEVPGPTFFELKQILRIAATTTARSSEEIERVFKELDGHAHR